MRAHPSLAVALVLAALIGGASFAQGPQQPDLEQRVDALETEVKAMKSEVAELKRRLRAAQAEPEAGVAANAQQVQQVVDYLDAVAKSAVSLDKVLSESEDKGFTYGINPDSRKVLLKGFHDFTATLQKDVPGKAPAGDAGSADKGGAR